MFTEWTLHVKDILHLYHPMYSFFVAANHGLWGVLNAGALIRTDAMLQQRF